METIRVLIVDDHPALRRGLRNLLAYYPDIEVVGEAESSATALQAALLLCPDVILLDIELPGQNGIELVHQLNRKAPESKIVILTAFDTGDYLTGALQAGVSAYLLKNTSDETVVEAIRHVYAGKRLLSPELMDTLLQQFESIAKAQARQETGLSEEELGVLDLIAQGATSREIGEQLHWSDRTVKRKIEDLTAKLGTKNRVEAVAQAIKNGWI